MKGEIILPELSHKIMGAVFEVHNQLGPGFTESVYENALVYEFELRGIAIKRQIPVKVLYKNRIVGNHRLDLIVEENIILELKAISNLSDDHKQQTFSYLKATNLHLGILINFGRKRIQYQQIVN